MNSKIREISELTKEEKKKVIEIVQNTDYFDCKTIIKMGVIKELPIDTYMKYLLEKTPKGRTLNKKSVLKMFTAKQKTYLAVQMKKQEISLRKDLMVYKEIKKSASEAKTVLELDCIALDIMIGNVEKLLESTTDAYQRIEVSLILGHLKDKKLSLESYCFILLQNILQAELQISNCEKICNEIKCAIC